MLEFGRFLGIKSAEIFKNPYSPNKPGKPDNSIPKLPRGQPDHIRPPHIENPHLIPHRQPNNHPQKKK